jgi:predicted negative regulator of RcsB-dependent stress response
MKKFLNILMNEEESFDNMPSWFYSIVVPLAMILLIGFAGWLETVME